MIRAVNFKKLDLSDEEFAYYLSIIKEFGEGVFENAFDTDEDSGFITLVKPPMNNTIPIGVVFFLLNVMLNQRMRKTEELNALQEEKLQKLEQLIAKHEGVNVK